MQELIKIIDALAKYPEEWTREPPNFRKKLYETTYIHKSGFKLYHWDVNWRGECAWVKLPVGKKEVEIDLPWGKYFTGGKVRNAVRRLKTWFDEVELRNSI